MISIRILRNIVDCQKCYFLHAALGTTGKYIINLLYTLTISFFTICLFHVSAVFYTSDVITDEECAFASLLVAMSCARERTFLGYNTGVGMGVKLMDFGVIVESIDKYIEVIVH